MRSIIVVMNSSGKVKTHLHSLPVIEVQVWRRRARDLINMSYTITMIASKLVNSWSWMKSIKTISVMEILSVEAPVMWS